MVYVYYVCYVVKNLHGLSTVAGNAPTRPAREGVSPAVSCGESADLRAELSSSPDATRPSRADCENDSAISIWLDLDSKPRESVERGNVWCEVLIDKNYSI